MFKRGKTGNSPAPCHGKENSVKSVSALNGLYTGDPGFRARLESRMRENKWHCAEAVLAAASIAGITHGKCL